MTAAPPLEVDGLARAFGAFALGELSLTVRRGEYWVLLGPSGCGKSMLLQTLCAFHRPERGRVLLEGRVATHEPPEARRIGLVFQNAALFPHLDVRENVAFGLVRRGLAPEAVAARVEAVVAALGLGAILERPVATLSGGEAQRVAIARAVAPEPSLLLLDEPLSLLDHNTRLELQAQLKLWHQDLGLTVLHVTHNRDEARALATHCAVMLGGKVVQAGPWDEVLAHPHCPFVARFLGAESAPTTRAACAERCLVAPARCAEPAAG